MFYGNIKGKRDKISIIDNFKRKGYITLGSLNQSHRELFYLKTQKNFKFVSFAPNKSPNNKNENNIDIYSKNEYVYMVKILLNYI